MTYRDFVARHIERYVDELTRFAAIPSIAGTPAATDAAQFVAGAFRQRGFRSDLVSTPGEPVVVSTAGAGDRTVLLYNHYDVQPADPIDAWTSHPFRPVLRDGKLFGRGVIDDKGEVVARLAAIDAVCERFGTLPLRLVACVEGEEEVGSPNLAQFVAENAARLHADACLWEGGTQDAGGRPVAWLGVRGVVLLELSVTTLAHDAHSGLAHALPSAPWRMVHALAELVDRDGHVTVPGLDGTTCRPSSAQRALLAAMPDEEAEYRAEFGVDRFVQGRHGTALREAVFEPTCNICGLWSGAIGGATKTIVPATAHAVVDLRLPPGIAPQDARRAVRARLDERGYGDVSIRGGEAEEGYSTDPDAPFVAMVREALQEAYGVEPVMAPLAGGTGPAAQVAGTLGLPVVSIGCSYSGARKHAPDENLRIDDFISGAAAIATLLAKAATA